MGRDIWHEFEAGSGDAGSPVPRRVASLRPTCAERTRPGRRTLAFLGLARDVVALWQSRSRQRRALAQMDGRLLLDIGLTPDDAQREAQRPFWQ